MLMFPFKPSRQHDVLAAKVGATENDQGPLCTTLHHEPNNHHALSRSFVTVITKQWPMAADKSRELTSSGRVKNIPIAI